MVETKKKKLGVTITSSEKVEYERYGKFKLTSMPYPGCEWFKYYRDWRISKLDELLYFDWTQSFVNAQLSGYGINQQDKQYTTMKLSKHDDFHEFDQHTLKQIQTIQKTDENHISASISTVAATDIISTPISSSPPPINVTNLTSQPDWQDYRNWPVITLTKNYLFLVLNHLADPAEAAGINVHCISGW
jgi:hypothetical protein